MVNHRLERSSCANKRQRSKIGRRGDKQMSMFCAKYSLGQVVRHKFFPFRGVIFDVDPTFNNTDEWWQSIPEHMRPRKDQPFYHLLAENEDTEYVAYVSEQNLLPDESGVPVRHPQVSEIFERLEDGSYSLHKDQSH